MVRLTKDSRQHLLFRTISQLEEMGNLKETRMVDESEPRNAQKGFGIIQDELKFNEDVKQESLNCVLKVDYNWP